MTQEQIVMTNNPFQALCDVMLIEVPENVTINIKISTDGKVYHEVDTPVKGPEIIEIGPIVRGTRMLLSSDQNSKIKIKS